jgi:putative transposase
MKDPQTPVFRKRYRIPSARLKAWDYRRPGMYFVTICTQEQDRCLGEVLGGEMSFSAYGEIVAREWRLIPERQPQVDLDTWIVMPDHLHGILTLKPTPEKPAQSLGMIIGEFKSKATKAIRMSGYRDFDWQERFHDHIIKNLEELDRIRTYILQNPQRWETKHNSTPVTTILLHRETVP